MGISALFIRRPVATSLLCLALVLAGVLAWRLLPVAPMPEVDIPTIKVSASLPGASPETVASAVAAPLERALGRIAGLTEMSSTSTLGNASIRLTFDLARDVDGAARDVQGALNAARGALPPDMARSPSYRTVTSADAPVLVLALTSRHATPEQMYTAASQVFVRLLSQVPGVGQVDLVGSSAPAIRVALHPEALNQHGITLATVRQALAASGVDLPTGTLELGDRAWQVVASAPQATAQAFRALPIPTRSGASVPLGALAQVSDGVRQDDTAALADGEPAVLALVRRKPGANIIRVIDGVHARLPALRAALPGDMQVNLVVDRATTVRASIHGAEHTLALAVALVIAVMLLFLRRLRSALIASVAAPISLLGALAVMYLLGYSLDNLSLMALTIAVGFAVDDAVVVVENIVRHMEEGATPWAAARHGAGEVGLTVLSMSAVLIAVFIPLLLMGGYVGLFVREFAVTLALVIAFSLLVSLTVVPTLCAWALRPLPATGAGSRWWRASGRGFAALQRGYDRSLDWALAHAGVILLLLLTTIALGAWLYVEVPKGFFPRQDTGELSGDFEIDGRGSYAQARQALATFAATVRADPAVAKVGAFVDGGSGSLFATLKPLAQRRDSADAVAARLNARLADIPGATFGVGAVQDIRVGGRRSRAADEYTIQADSSADLRLWTPRILRALRALPELRDVRDDSAGSGLVTALTVERDAASRLGVSYAQVGAALHDAFAGRQATQVPTPAGPVAVLMGVAPQQAQSPAALAALELAGSGGAPVALPVISRVTQHAAPLAIDHFGQAVSATFSFNRAPGVSLSQATRAIQRTVDGLALPSSIRSSFQGSAGAFRQVVASEPILVLAALFTLFIVLGVLYESTMHPLTILSTMPSAAIGAVFALMLLRTDFDVIALIGIFALVGIVMKNAIMMVDFALLEQRQHGLDAHAAIRRACQLRLRPILMTSLAVMVAALPLALTRGDGAEMQRPLGIVMGGGLVVSQLLTLYTTPVVYLYLDRLSRWLRARWHRGGDGNAPAPRPRHEGAIT